MVDLAELRAAAEAWMAAEDAYQAEADRHIGVRWEGDEFQWRGVEPMTNEALARLTDLREAVDTARSKFGALLAEARSR
jgi:hypothetical protein